MSEKIIATIAPFALVLSAYAATRWAMEGATAISWVFGAVVAVVLGVLLVWLLIGMNLKLRKKESAHPPSVILSIFLLLVLMGAAVCACVSVLLHSKHWAIYNATKDLGIGRFVDYYMWVFIDMIPGIEFWKTLNVHPPIESSNFVAALPVLAFRAFVVYGVLTCFEKWYKSRTELTKKVT